MGSQAASILRGHDATTATLLAMIPVTPAAAKHFEGDCCRTAEGVTTCVHTYTEGRLLRTARCDDCVIEQGDVGRCRTETYATVEVTDTKSYKRHKVMSHYG